MDIDDDEKSWHPESATPPSEEFISDHEESEEEDALQPEYEHTCKCSDGCHTWHELERRNQRIWTAVMVQDMYSFTDKDCNPTNSIRRQSQQDEILLHFQKW